MTVTTMKNKYKYSVIIPLFNSASTIRETVESVVKSGLVDYQIILVDDGSKDNTQNICQKLVNDYCFVSYLHKENGGVSSARNFGIEHADGEYIWFIDSDDTVNENSLTKVHSVIGEYYPDIVIFGISFDYYHEGKIYRSEELIYPEEVILSHEQIQKQFMELYKCNALTSSCNKFIKSSILKEKNIRYDEDLFLLEDLLFSINYIMLCKNAYVLPQALYRYRQSEDEGNVYKRIKRINDIYDYLLVFKESLEDHKEVYSSIYYMILRQKLWISTIGQIRELSVKHISHGCTPYNDEDKRLDRTLCFKMFFA